jgi:hypothetical protein
MTVYQVVDWQENFEGAKSRTYNHKTTCTMPTKHGLGYKKMVRSKDGPAIFGAWCALVQVLSRHPAKRQGYCTDTGRIDGKPYTPDDLEMLTDISSKYFKQLMEVAINKDVAWLRIPDGYHKDTKYPLNSDSDSDLNSDSDSDSKGAVSRSKRKTGRVSENTELMKRIGSWFGRLPTTLWTAEEALKLKDVNPSEEEVAKMEAYYMAQPAAGKDYRRHCVETLLNNWPGELDRAIRHSQPSSTQPSRKQMPLFNPQVAK